MNLQRVRWEAYELIEVKKEEKSSRGENSSFYLAKLGLR
jgi:hypothetical protein